MVGFISIFTKTKSENARQIGQKKIQPAKIPHITKIPGELGSNMPIDPVIKLHKTVLNPEHIHIKKIAKLEKIRQLSPRTTQLHPDLDC